MTASSRPPRTVSMKTEEKKNRSGVGNRWRREEESLWRRKSLEKRRRFALALRSRWRREEESLWRRKSGDCSVKEEGE